MKKWEKHIMIGLLGAALLCNGCGALSLESAENGSDFWNVSSESGMWLDEETEALQLAQDNQNVSQELKSLMKENFNVYIFIYGLDMLQGQTEDEVDWNNPDSYIRQVSTEAYADYAAFEAYIRSVYCKEKADALLANGRYLNRDGALYEDMRQGAARGYYANYQIAEIVIDQLTDTSCEFRYVTLWEEPGEDVSGSSYEIPCKAVKEEDGWRLVDLYS